MRLLGEEVVEEWLNRNGYFTIRGVKLGIDEIDILAIKPLSDGQHECRHIEVQVSINPVSCITKVPEAIRKKSGVGAHNAKKRGTAQLTKGIREWVDAKFNNTPKKELKNSLCSGSWTKELIIGKVKHEEEIDILKKEYVTIHRLKDILAEMVEKPSIVKAAAGADLYDLMLLRQ
jgi:hypothetical protein